MTLIIKNVKEEYIPAFREFAEKMEAKLVDESDDDECHICEDYKPSDELLEAIAEVEDMKSNPRAYKSYSSGKEVIEACLNG